MRFPALPFILLTAAAAPAADWVHWRGPQQTGVSADTKLPEAFADGPAGKGPIVWKQPFGGRSAPLVLKGRLYTIGGYDMSQATEGERVLCFDAEKGTKLWEHRFNVFHTDIVSSRLGWTTLTADPEKELVYAHTTGGFLFCFNKDGKVVWQRQLTEEFGRVTGYGGRIVSPIFDEGLVIVGMVNGSWGDQSRGNNRFAAFDSQTGEVVWWSSPTEDLKNPAITLRGTYYSNPVIAVIGGQRLLITGGADGCVHALKARTGERVWSYPFSAGVVNPSPVVDGNMVYCCHGEENPEGGPIGRVVCLDASQVAGKKPKLVWEFRKSNRFGLASPALADGRLYVPDDSSELFCFNAKSGKLLWREKYGTVSRGAPLVADGKLYVFDVNARLAVMTLDGDKDPGEPDNVSFRTSGVGFVETHGTPIAVNGKLYFLTQEAVYCVAEKDGKAGTAPAVKAAAAETAFNANAEPVAVRVFPADVSTKPGAEVKFALKFLDANGREVKAPADAKAEWSLPLPPPTPTGVQPPAFDGTVTGDAAGATLAVNPKRPRQAGVALVKVGNLTAQARVRAIAQLPYAETFEIPKLAAPNAVGPPPSGWVNVTGKYTLVNLNGSNVLSKVNTDARPPLARANGYITNADASNYTIEADVMGTEVRGKFPDMGLVNSRYTLILDGKSDGPGNQRQARIVSWEARPRVNATAVFNWQPNVWYRVKLTADPATSTVRAKVWEKEKPEPDGWLIEYKDPSPNKDGAAAVYAYVSDPSISPENPGSNVYFDNVSVTPNK